MALGYFDAAYGIHEDGKSHTGACLTIGDRGPVSVESTKQSIVAKSSTEAELVATSDSANMLLHLRNFLVGQGHPQTPATVYQDNMSCMSLIDKGRSTSKKTRHIAMILLDEGKNRQGRNHDGTSCHRAHGTGERDDQAYTGSTIRR